MRSLPSAVPSPVRTPRRTVEPPRPPVRLDTATDLQRLAACWSLPPCGDACLRDASRPWPADGLRRVATGDGVSLWWAPLQGTRAPARRVLATWLEAASAVAADAVVLVCGHGAQVTVAMHLPGGDGARIARTFDADDEAGLHALVEAGVDSAGAVEVLALELEEVLERRPLGQAFVRDFRAAWLRVARAWTHVPVDAPQVRRELALLVLTRLLFVAFLQARGWLDGRRHFLAEQSASHRDEPDTHSLYRDLLEVLFFGVLNTPPDQRSPAARALGDVPYLNGGLFGQTALEAAWPRRDLPDEVVREVLDGLFGRYVFAATEASARGTAAIDPAMLGHIFEALMAEGQRASSGSFYTPRRVVQRILGEALRTWARGRFEALGLDRPLDDALRALLPCPGHTARRSATPDASGLSREQARVLDAALEHIRIVDPAAGSGAFVIGAFELLVAVRAALAVRLGRRVELDVLRRHVATHNLYGVDLLPAAIRLCELRLWLALSVGSEVVEAADVPPLPNLDLSLRHGDALLELDDLDTLVACVEADGAAAPRDAERLAALRARYLDAVGTTKARLGREIETLEGELFADILDTAIARLDARLDALDRLAAAPTLFGDRRGLHDAERTLRHDLATRRTALRGHRDRLARDQQRPCFAWGLHFADVMARGGFDLVVGNPPWVRPHHQEGRLKARLRTRYLSCHRAAWRAGARLGSALRAGQVDLSAVFVERGVQLARPGGVVAMLLPNSLLGTLGAGGWRRLVAERTRIEAIVDWSRVGQQLFSAATYPTLLVATRRDPAALPDASGTLSVSRVEPGGREQHLRVARRDLALDVYDPASPWLPIAPSDRQALARMQARGVPLGERFELRRGVVTGHNAAFVATSAVLEPGSGLARVQLAGEHEARVERSHLRPVLRGGDVAAWSVAPSRVLLWTHDDATGAPLAALPPHLGQWLARCEGALRRRSDLSASQPWWSVFRVTPELAGPKVVWRDIGERLEAAFVPATGPVLPLNTVYYVPVRTADEGYLLAALLNSAPARRFAAALADRVRGGYRRFYAWVVGLVPWPFDAVGAVLTARLAQASRRLHGHGDAPLDEATRRHLLDVIEQGVAEAFALDGSLS